MKTIDNWSNGWKNKDVELSIKDYAHETDWTNAFGDRVKSKKELKALLERIYSMDFVMAGNSNYVENDFEFIDKDIAMLRSKNVRKNQEWSDGSKMVDRHINHLRVFKRIDDKWQIISHMISQAHEKK